MTAGALAILVVTCERYRALAELTGRVLDRHWAGHPPTFYCGAPGAAGATWLPLDDDPADWMAIVRRAVADLRARGFEQGYLILEDHLPLFPCHAGHLGETLPGLMATLGAAFVGLNGWGQGKPRGGERLDPARFAIERLDPAFPWKFQLHPALWRLSALAEILEALLRTLPPGRRSPWAFERAAGGPDATIPAPLKRQAYRVWGEGMTARPGRARRLGVERALARLARAAAGRLGGEGAWRRVDELVRPLFGYYEGPYPLFRSGVLVRGRLNPDLVRFLRVHGGGRLLREIVAAAAAIPAQVPAEAPA
jgi:hypothetical protein